MGQPAWWQVVEATVATLGTLAFLSSYVAIPIIVARRRQKARGTPIRSTIRLAFMLTLLLESIWWGIALVPALFLEHVFSGAFELALILLWAGLTIPVGVRLVWRLISGLSDTELDAFMSFRRRPQG
jgi:hypothetical protein